MKKRALIFTLLCAFSAGYAQNKEIKFDHSSFKELKAKAKKESKLIFIDAYTSWCGPCKWLAQNVFTNDTVADYFNSKFINAKMDMEKGEGPEIAKQYSVGCYPSSLFIDGDGKLIHRFSGALKPEQFLQKAEEAFDKEKRFSALSDKYESKKFESVFLIDYMGALYSSCMKIDEIVKEYFATQKEADLMNRNNWRAIYNYCNDFNSKEFNYLLVHIDEFKKLYTNDSVDEKIKQVLIGGGYKVIYKKEGTEKDYNSYIEAVKKVNYGGKDEVVFNLGLVWNSKTENWAEYAKIATAEGDKYLVEPGQMNEVAWTLYEKSNDKMALEKAEGWMKKATTANVSEWAFFDTYAAILYKLHKKNEAKQMAEKAIGLAKENGLSADDYKSTQDLLDKIEKL